MDAVTVRELEGKQAQTADRSPCFSFTSGERELVARGLMARIDAPAAGGHEAGSRFLRTIETAFDRARQAGQGNPIVVGAIPFEVTQASCLYVPEQYEWRHAPAVRHIGGAAPPALIGQHSAPDEHAFKAAVEQAIVHFRQGDVRKAVLSVQRELTFARDIDVHAMQSRLRAQNRQGHLSRVPLPNEATLLGVSPELLVRKQGRGFVSNPLAGSAKRLSDPQADQRNADALAASEKDHHEHRFVISGIVSQLDGWCSRLHIPERPSLVSTPTLWHLSTRIEGELADPRITALQLACRLHPTPAVCGFPTELARRLIRSVEPFERGLFTGMVGWCDASGNGEWVVTIRSGTVSGRRMKLFAGAGIVEASSPDAEWAEVQTKLGTMLHACGLAN